MTTTRHAPRPFLRVAALLLLLAAFALAGCGTKTVTGTGANGQATTQTVPNVHFAKTKFLLHAGLAFGAIHRYIYKPLRAGALRSGAPGRIKVLLKGAAAALFAVHELKIARGDALSSNLLRPLVNKIDSLGSKLSGLISGLKSGNINPAAILGSSGIASSLESASGGLGAGIKDISSAVG